MTTKEQLQRVERTVCNRILRFRSGFKDDHKQSPHFLDEKQRLRVVILFTQPHRFLMAKTNENLHQFLGNKNQ